MIRISIYFVVSICMSAGLFVIILMANTHRAMDFDYAGAELASLMNVAVGMPDIERNEFTGVAESVITQADEIFKEQDCKWQNIKMEKWLRISNIAAKDFKHIDRITQEHISYLQILPTQKYGSGKGNIRDITCSGKVVSTCYSPLSVMVNDYVLQKPELFKRLIDVASRPCEYIKKTEETKRGDKALRFKITDARKKLWCNQRSHYTGFVILSVIEPKSKNIIDIVVNRKDIQKGKFL